MRSLVFLLREAFVNLNRHGLMTAAAVTTIAVSLALLGAFSLTFYQINTAAHRAVNAFEMRAFCRPEMTKKDSGRLTKKIAALPGVSTVRYMSRAEIWAEQTRNYPIDTAGIPNQMPDTFVIKLSDAARASAVAHEIRGWHGEIDSVDLPEKEMSGVLRIADFVKTLGLAGGVVLLFGALIVVSNTIRISVFARRREIKIMQLVGATTWFIRLPLLIEGLIHGTLGGLLATLCLFGVGRYVAELIATTVPMLVPYGGSVDVLRFSLLLVSLGALIGMLGSLLSIRRYLRAV